MFTKFRTATALLTVALAMAVSVGSAAATTNQGSGSAKTAPNNCGTYAAVGNYYLALASVYHGAFNDDATAASYASAASAVYEAGMAAGCP